MFKRVARRQERQERDEEMGLDAETKEVLGLHDTDSEESSSSSGSEDDSDAEEEVGGVIPVVESETEDEDEDEGLSEHDEGSEEDAHSDDDQEPQLSVAEALKDPLYLISLEPEVRACIACRGKLLKNAIMCEVHRSSNAHVRRYKRFTELAQQAGLETDVRDIVSQLSAGPEKSADAAVSRRAKKRQDKLAKVKAKREKQKQMKAKGIAGKKERAAKATAGAPEAEGEAKPATRPAKKRKLEEEGDAQPTGTDSKPRTSEQTTKSPAATAESLELVKKSKAERKVHEAKSPMIKSSSPSPPEKARQSLPLKPPKSAMSTKDSRPKASKPARVTKGSDKSSVLSNGKKRKRLQKDTA
ncbi:uncharacterized protein C8Q71DRAFT_856519 [Rhodofomes roseus]|uniref:Uncharacterized protein n=1 Tax=Rhodofomes roseus TaxID=34475 RepID=A0A4Y9YZK1_9APHY|nr:uncharacterized protein C8Q71DRAFT_856519 [Rhodofomes roseus]KAH9838582.1 hypothetical protein C8Q71DRAFT_856519 [Rhodofomes roseus]TFY67692.1 hypothetical protein EVJ58_g1449 [Rhodofomes roseus]